MSGLSLMMVCGKVEVSVDRNEGKIFTGVGPFGLRKHFDWNSIKSIDEETSGANAPGSYGLTIAMTGQNKTKFGSLLNETRRFYLLQTLRKLMATRATSLD